MRCEIPILTRCCFCLPLRYGLLVWAYLKQICSLFILTMMIIQFCWKVKHYGFHPVGDTLMALAILALIMDICFHIMFIISAHMKEYKKMRIFYRYSLFVISLCIIAFFLLLGFGIFCAFQGVYLLIYIYYLILPCMGFVVAYIILQWYLIVLTRSEFLKLKNNSQFEFVNHATDEKCTADIVFSKGMNV